MKLNTGAMGIIDCGTLSATDAVQPLLNEARECFEVLVQADPANTLDVSIGNDLVQWWVLEAGDTLRLAVSHINKVYVHFPADVAQRINWIAMR